jgi:hypothetical protein
MAKDPKRRRLAADRPTKREAGRAARGSAATRRGGNFQTLGQPYRFSPQRAAQLAAQDTRLLENMVGQFGIEAWGPSSNVNASGMDDQNWSGSEPSDRDMARMATEYDSGQRRMVSLKGTVMRVVANGVRRACLQTAQCIAQNAQQTILTNVGGKGQALGSGPDEVYLANSIYLTTGKKSGYEAAKAAAQSSKTNKRRRWAPEVVPQDNGPQSFSVAVASAYDGAAAIHNGYADANNGEFMRGTPFMTDAVKKCEPKLKAGAEQACMAASKVKVPTQLDKYNQQQAKAQSMLAAANREANLERFYDVSIGDSMQRQRIWTQETHRGRTRQFIKVEELDDWLQRIYEAWAGAIDAANSMHGRIT